jgi:hypothetical protein
MLDPAIRGPAARQPAQAQPGDVRGRGGRRGHLRPATCEAVRSEQRRRASSPDVRSGSGSPCCSPTSPRPWPKAAARPRPSACGTRPRPWPRRVAGPPWIGLRTAGVPIPPPCRSATRSSGRGRRHHPGRRRGRRGHRSVDESAITGESAPVIREAGGDRSAVTGGTTGAVRPDRRARSPPSRARRSSTG